MLWEPLLNRCHASTSPSAATGYGLGSRLGRERKRRRRVGASGIVFRRSSSTCLGTNARTVYESIVATTASVILTGKLKLSLLDALESNASQEALHAAEIIAKILCWCCERPPAPLSLSSRPAQSRADQEHRPRLATPNGARRHRRSLRQGRDCGAKPRQESQAARAPRK
jgi:hypothetical protein